MRKVQWTWKRRAKNDGVDRRATEAPPLQPFTSADLDQATGALKWDRFMSILEAQPQEQSGALLLIDLTDQSRRMVENDERMRSDLLPLLAQALQQAIRVDDLIAHSDGFRFAILLRGASEDVSRAACERILASVEDTIVFTGERLVKVSVAVGGTRFGSFDEGALLKAQEKLAVASSSTHSVVAL